MNRRSFLHPDHAYTTAPARQSNPEQAPKTPDIFVVPPEEDQIPPWCCYNSQQSLTDDEDEDYTLTYSRINSNTPYFPNDVADIEGLIMPTRKGSSGTRSIVDALGDADDYLGNEYDHETLGMGFEYDEGDDGLEAEMEAEREHRRISEYQPYNHEEFGVQRQLRPPLREVDDDPDVVEVVKVRRKSAFINDPGNANIYGPSNVGSKSTFRSRASQAFRSLGFGSRRGPPKMAPQTKDPMTSTKSMSKTSLSLAFRSKTHSKPRAQDIFAPIENTPEPDRPPGPRRSHTPDPFRRSSTRKLLPALKRRASTNSFTFKSPTQPVQTPVSSCELSHKKFPSQPHSGSITPSRRSSSSLHTRQKYLNQESEDAPTPTKGSHRSQFEDDQPTPSRHALESRNTERVIPARSTSPSPPSRQAKKGFSVLNLHKLFQKSSSSHTPSEPQSPKGQASSNSSANSTCPSLSSTPTSEWSGRTSPTSDSVPQTPTSFDENDARRTIAPVQSSSTVGSGISLGSSLQSGAISCLSSSNSTSSATTHDSTTAAFDHTNHTALPQKSSLSLDRSVSPYSDSDPPRPSITSSHSVYSTSTAGGTVHNGVHCRSQSTVATTTAPTPAPSTESTSTDPALDMTLHLDLELDLGLNINMTPSESGGMLSSNGLSRSAPKSTLREKRGRATLGRSLSLKNLGNKLGISKGDVPPVPPLPGQEEDLEMRLDSLHFEDMSFDAERFMVR